VFLGCLAAFAAKHPKNIHKNPPESADTIYLNFKL
jgi:hypothetical protein